jgi:hypothetical protein
MQEQLNLGKCLEAFSKDAGARFEDALSACSKVPTDNMTKRKRKGKSKPRTRSPLRPGVYVGHEARKHALVSSSRRKPPPGLPNFANAGDGHSGMLDPKTHHLQDSESQCENVKSKHMMTWRDMVEELDDERHVDESKQYNAWRKKVIECARNMQMEVSRFKLDEK